VIYTECEGWTVDFSSGDTNELSPALLWVNKLYGQNTCIFSFSAVKVIFAIIV
jgi:hypothetical protein